jgi:protoporphyrinogen/coproporphyrinogen III oxidase
MNQPEVVVVGAGITGLTCAYRLKKLGIDAVVLESSDRIGGVIRSENVNGHLVEWGPGSLLPTAHTYGILEETGLDKELIEADPKSPRYIVVNGQLRPIPLGPLSFKGILRGLGEPFIRSKSQGDESVASFFRRRFGDQILERLAGPFVTGIFAGNVEKLSVGSVFPRVLEIEQEYGSVIWGMLRAKPKPAKAEHKPRKSSISSFPTGLGALPAHLSEGLSIQTGCSGIRIGKDVQARATVLSVPGHQAAGILQDLYPDLAAPLRSIEYAPVVVAATSLPVSSLTVPLRGFGFLAPRSEGMTVLGTVFNSLLFTGRAPDERILLTSFLGGAVKPEVYDWPETRIWDTVGAELKRVLKTSLQPEPLGLFRHRWAIPQYNIGHRQRVDEIAAQVARVPGLFITGNFLHGVSVPACLEHGDNTAVAVSEFLGGKA